MNGYIWTAAIVVVLLAIFAVVYIAVAKSKNSSARKVQEQQASEALAEREQEARRVYAQLPAKARNKVHKARTPQAREKALNRVLRDNQTTVNTSDDSAAVIAILLSTQFAADDTNSYNHNTGSYSGGSDSGYSEPSSYHTPSSYHDSGSSYSGHSGYSDSGSSYSDSSSSGDSGGGGGAD